MAYKVFVSLPVKNIEKSMRFFSEIGFSSDKKHTDEVAACMGVTDDMFVMLMTEEKFKMFTPKQICDTTKSTEVLVCLSLDSQEEVDDMIHKAVSAGGTTYDDPHDYGFMYAHGFQDLDNHIWEVVYMDPNTITQG